MMDNYTLACSAAAYLVFTLLTFSATVAHFQRKFAIIAKENYWADVLFAAFIAATPVGWFVAFIMTKFYSFGFQFGPQK